MPASSQIIFFGKRGSVRPAPSFTSTLRRRGSVWPASTGFTLFASERSLQRRGRGCSRATGDCQGHSFHERPRQEFGRTATTASSGRPVGGQHQATGGSGHQTSARQARRRAVDSDSSNTTRDLGSSDLWYNIAIDLGSKLSWYRLEFDFSFDDVRNQATLQASSNFGGPPGA